MIKPLAAALSAFPKVKGIQVAVSLKKNALFVDNIVLFLQDSDESLSSALSILNSFSNYSRLKVNWIKSQILPLVCYSGLTRLNN